jgi:hypothetical protein
MARQTIKAAIATDRERTKAKEINADFLIWQAGIALWTTNTFNLTHPISPAVAILNPFLMLSLRLLYVAMRTLRKDAYPRRITNRSNSD